MPQDLDIDGHPTAGRACADGRRHSAAQSHWPIGRRVGPSARSDEELATSFSTRPLAISLTASTSHIVAGLAARDASILGSAQWLMRAEMGVQGSQVVTTLQPPMASNSTFGWVNVGGEPRIWRGGIGETVLELLHGGGQSPVSEAFPGFSGIQGVKPGTTEVVDHAGQVFWAVGYVMEEGSDSWTPTIARWGLSGPPGQGRTMSTAITSWSFPLVTAWAEGAMIAANHDGAGPNTAGPGLWLGHVDNQLAVVRAADVGLPDATLPNGIVRVAGGDVVVAFRSNGVGVDGAPSNGALPGIVRLNSNLQVRWVQRWPQQSFHREWIAVAADGDDAVAAYFETGRTPQDRAAGRAILRLTRATKAGAEAQQVLLEHATSDPNEATAVAIGIRQGCHQPVLALWYGHSLHTAVLDPVPPRSRK